MHLDFICIGAQKSGTTTLHNILNSHPDIYLPNNKEAHFFDQEERYIKGVKWWEDTFFNDYAGQKVRGVFTPEYLYFAEVPGRIFSHMGIDIKILVILRNPVDRAFSHYLMSKRRAFETLTFEEAIKTEPQRISKGDFERNHFSYIDRGFYAEQLKRYYGLFKSENILILNFERNIKQNLSQTVLRIENFLGVGNEKLNTSIRSNPASEPYSVSLVKLIRKKSSIKTLVGKMIPKEIKRNLIRYILEKNLKEIKVKNELNIKYKKKLVDQYFKKDIERLMMLTGVDFENWFQ